VVSKIFVNLPVQDLQKSRAFFGSLGFSFNPQFSDDTGACLVVSDVIHAMLLTRPKFAQFTDKSIVDGHQSAEVIVALGVDDKDDVNRIADAALNAGAQEPRPPQDYGFMFLRSFQDLDGHIWEVAWMNPNHVQQ